MRDVRMPQPMRADVLLNPGTSGCSPNDPHQLTLVQMPLLAAAKYWRVVGRAPPQGNQSLPNRFGQENRPSTTAFPMNRNLTASAARLTILPFQPGQFGD